MNNVLVTAILLPALAFFGGLLIMTIVSGYGYVKKQLRERATPGDRKGLHMRFRGYDPAAVGRHWGVLDQQALQILRYFLLLDLLFPLLYGSALVVAVLGTWDMLGKTFSPIWLIVPVIITVIADWTENLIHLVQLRLYMERGKAGLEAGWIRIASLATTVKLLFFGAVFMYLVIFTIYAAVRFRQSM